MKIAVAISGASGAIYAHQLLQTLESLKGKVEEVALVWSSNAKMVWRYELENENYLQLPFRSYENTDFMAPFASGSSSFKALIICPCSMGILGRIAGGISNDLITRAADVMLKERRRLICMVRETPLNLIHLRNMTTITEAGGIICPATPSFYSQPKSIAEAVQTVVDRALQLAGVETNGYRWQEND